MRALSGLFALVLLARSTPPADATPGTPPGADTTATRGAALVHLERGVAAFRAGEFARAHAELAIAHDLAPDKPNPYRWLALTEIQLGDCARALVNLEEFLARVPPTDPRVPEMTRWRELCARTGVLRVATTPPAATLRIDGAVVGATPFRSLSMRAGTHTLVAAKPGHRSATRSVIVRPGEALDIELVLPRARVPVTARWWFWPAVGAAAVTLVGATVYVATGADARTLPPVQCDALGCRP